MSDNLQYGVLYRRKRDDNSKPYVCMDDVTHISIEDALREANNFYGEGGWSEDQNWMLLGMFSIDMANGQIIPLYNRAQLLHLLEDMQRESCHKQTIVHSRKFYHGSYA